jgi:WD40 repeat protein
MDVAFSSDSTKIGFCCSDGSVGTFSIRNKKVERLFTDYEPGHQVCTVSLNKIDTLIASASKNGKIVIRRIDEEQG